MTYAAQPWVGDGLDACCVCHRQTRYETLNDSAVGLESVGGVGMAGCGSALRVGMQDDGVAADDVAVFPVLGGLPVLGGTG